MGSVNGASLDTLPIGTNLEVSAADGSGFCSLFDATESFQSALTRGRSLLLVGACGPGIAALRAVLAWTPVLTHATRHGVAVVLAATCPAAAPFVLEWDAWRQAGVSSDVLSTGQHEGLAMHCGVDGD